MILHGTTAQALRWRCGLTALVIAALLPLLPAWVRAEEPSAEKRPIEQKSLEVQTIEAEKAKAETDQLAAELRAKMNEVRELERRLKEAQEHAKKAIRVWQVPSDDKALTDGVLYLRLQGAPRKEKMGTLYEMVPGENGALLLRPVAPPAPAKVEGSERIRVTIQPAVEATPALGKKPPVIEVRTEGIEKRLDALTREVEQLRQEIKATRFGATAAPKKAGIRWLEIPADSPEPAVESPESREQRQQKLELEKALRELQKAVDARKKLEDAQPKK